MLRPWLTPSVRGRLFIMSNLDELPRRAMETTTSQVWTVELHIHIILLSARLLLTELCIEITHVAQRSEREWEFGRVISSGVSCSPLPNLGVRLHCFGPCVGAGEVLAQDEAVPLDELRLAIRL